MLISVKARNVTVNDDLRARIEKRFEKIGRQVPAGAELEVEMMEERTHSAGLQEVVEVTLRLKGTTLRARESAASLTQALNEVVGELSRQVKRHKDKQRRRRPSARAEPRPAASP
jgi:putative sigma-54 modulation protein